MAGDRKAQGGLLTQKQLMKQFAEMLFYRVLLKKIEALEKDEKQVCP